MKTITLPGSKSITNRDLILASLCEGRCEIKGYLQSEDTKYMIDALKNIGIGIIKKNGNLIVDGGINKIAGNNKELYIHQSGTCMRFLTGLTVLNKKGTIAITGDKRLLVRPMGDLFDGITQMGVKLQSNGNYPPVKVFPSEIKNNKIKINGTSSSQFFTSLMQVGAFVSGGLEIEVVGDLVSKPYIDLTIEELRKFGLKTKNDNYKSFFIEEQKFKNPGVLQVEGDASALSYFANYVILKKTGLEITNIGKNSKQGDYEYLEVLKKHFLLEFYSDGESTILSGSNIIKNKESYREIDFENMPDVSMSFMSLAPLFPGKTKITGLQTLNLKECRRIDVMGEQLKKLGVNLEYDDKSIIILEGFSPPELVKIDTHDDHRIAMVFGILKIHLEENYNTKIEILNSNCVGKTYPNFWEDIKSLNN